MKKEVQRKFDDYPQHIKPLLSAVRYLVVEIAKTQNLGPVTETLKWGEPSYQVKTGSPVRVDWKPKYPEQYFIFFNCHTKLVDTFRELYADVLSFQGNRAIVLQVNQALPEQAIRHCLELAMNYKHIKHLPMLGA
jgi:hypothetical protein